MCAHHFGASVRVWGCLGCFHVVSLCHWSMPASADSFARLCRQTPQVIRTHNEQKSLSHAEVEKHRQKTCSNLHHHTKPASQAIPAVFFFLPLCIAHLTHTCNTSTTQHGGFSSAGPSLLCNRTLHKYANQPLQRS